MTSTFTFNPREPAFVEDPYPFYRALRDNAPAYRDEETGLWLITRYGDVERATRETSVFSSAQGNTIVDSPTRVGKTLGTMDPPRHDELRRIVQRGLGVPRIDAILPAVRETTIERWERVRDRGEVDLIAEISRPILFGALGRLMGFDDDASEKATELTKDLFHQDDGPYGSVLPPETFEEIARFLLEQTRLRSNDRGDDVISALLDAQDAGAPLSEEEIVANVSTVLLAGNASIGHFFPNLIYALWLHPEQRRAVLDDPALIMAAIEEGVRWDTSTQCFARHVVVDTDIDGTVIPANSRAVIFYGSANRDERAIPNPDIFDIQRKRVRHFGFGMGPHVCAGAPAARAIMRTIMTELLPALGDYELDLERAKRVGHVMVRGFSKLPISWTK